LRPLNPILLCLLAAILATPARAAQTYQLNRVAAVVNGELITLYDLQIQASQEFYRQGLTGTDSYADMQRQYVMREVLESMIVNILIRQEAERIKVVVEDKEVDNSVRVFMQGNGFSQEELENRLLQEGSNLAEFRKKMRDNILRQRMISLMITRKADISRSDIEEYYARHLNRFSTPSKVSLSMIIFAPASRPEAVREQITGGAISFAEAARKYSQSPTASIGGRLGEIPWRDLNPVWRESLEGLSTGDLSPLLHNGDMTILLHVDAVQEGTVQSLEEVAEIIEEELREPKLRERFSEYTEQLRSRSMVDVRI